MKPYKFTFMVLIPLLLLSAPDASAENAIVYMNSGLQHYRNKDYNEAIRHFEKAISINKYYKEAYNMLGLCYTAGGNYKKAKECLNKAIEIAPMYMSPHHVLGTVFFAEGRYDDAVKEFGLVAKYMKDDTPALRALGSVYWKKGNLTESVRCFQRYLDLDTKSVDAIVNLSALYRMTGDYAKADAFLKSAVSIDKTSRIVMLNNALLLERQNKYSSAIALMEKIKPKDRSINRHLGRIYAKNAEWKKAMKLFEDVARDGKGTMEDLFNLAVASENAGNAEFAIKNYKTLNEYLPNDEFVLYRLEELLVKEKLVSFPDRRLYSQFHKQQGKDYADRADYRNAYREYFRAMKLNPQDAEIREKLAEMFEKDNKVLKAMDLYGKAEELESNQKKYSDKILNLSKVKYNLVSYKSGLFDEEFKPPVTSSSVAVLDFTYDFDRVVHIELNKVLSGMAYEELSRVEKIKPIPPRQIYSAMAKRGLKKISNYADCQRIARDVGAEYFVYGTVGEGDDTIVLNVSMVNTATSSEIGKWKIAKEGRKRVFSAVGEITDKIENTMPALGKIIRIDGENFWTNLNLNYGVKKGDALTVTIDRGVTAKIKVVDLDERVSRCLPVDRHFMGAMKINMSVRK